MSGNPALSQSFGGNRAEGIGGHDVGTLRFCGHSAR